VIKEGGKELIKARAAGQSRPADAKSLEGGRAWRY